MIAYEKEKEAERLRLEAEQRKLLEKEKEKMERKAERAEVKGDQTTADAMRSAARVMPTAPIINNAPPKVSGLTTRANWGYRIDDREGLIKWLIDTPEYHYLLDVNEKELGKLVKAMKDHTNIKHVTVSNDPSKVKTRR